MLNKINGRTPEEIKRMLRCLSTPCAGECEECEHDVGEADFTPYDAYVCALELIQQLERERDAAVEDLEAASEQKPYCETCIHANTDANEEPCVDCMAGYLANLWQWRGVQEVELNA
jgi:hypothetical protein